MIFPRLAVTLFGLACLSFAQTQTKNIVLITSDGLRWQELFGGMDAALAQSLITKDTPLKAKLSKNTPEERRLALMPFFWGKLAAHGVVLGNVQKDSSVRVTNAFKVSYPGYSEILTGRAQDDLIKGNTPIQNPSETFLEFLGARLKLQQKQVALFASWDVFRVIGESKPGSIFINAGYQKAEDSAQDSPLMRQLSGMQFEALTPWDETRHDYVTFQMAFDHMKREKPRVIYIALGETDDWAHDRRYDRVLGSIQYLDEALRQLFAFLDTDPAYKGKTSVILTSDHGRGSTLLDWHSHGAKVVGAEQIWMALFGPDVPAKGEVGHSAPAFQRDIAPTILSLLGIDPGEYKGATGSPVSLR